MVSAAWVKGGRVKGNVDAELVLQAMIVSGDGDFHCLIKHLKDKKKLEKLIIPNRDKFSSLLRKFIPNDAVFMNNLKGKLEYRKP